MASLDQKYQRTTHALATLKEAVAISATLAKTGKSSHPLMSYEEARGIYRDAMILRFRYSADLFWRYLAKILEARLTAPIIQTPVDVIEKSCATGIITQSEATAILTMIRDRNMVPHMHIEKLAQELIKKIPGYYQLMYAAMEKIKPQ